MAIMVSNWWNPNTSGAYGPLVANLTGMRDVMREVGWRADVVTLMPGGGGPIGQTGLITEFSSLDEYVAAIDSPPDPKVMEHQRDIETSDSVPIRSTTSMEIAGTEISYEELPKNVVQVSHIKPIPEKMQDALVDIAKSQAIWRRVGIPVRAMQAVYSDPWPALTFVQYFDSGQMMAEKTQALFADAEWNSHFANSLENRQIVRQSAYRVLE